MNTPMTHEERENQENRSTWERRNVSPGVSPGHDLPEIDYEENPLAWIEEHSGNF